MGEECCDGCGGGAAGAVSMDTADEGGFDEEFGFGGVEAVDGRFQAFEVSALDEDGATEAGVEVARGLTEVFDFVEFALEEESGFVAVGGNERGEGEEEFREGPDGVGFQEAGSAGGDHDGVDDHWG